MVDDLQRLSVENPAAEQELLRQLQAAEPKHWDLIVRRFNSTLAYNRILSTPIRGGGTLFASQTTPAAAQTDRAEPTAASRPLDSRRVAHQPRRDAYGSASRTPPDAARAAYLEPPRPVEGTRRQTPPPSTAWPAPDAGASAPRTESEIRLVSAVAEAASTPPEVEVPAGQPAAPTPTRPSVSPGDWRGAIDNAAAMLETLTPADPQSTAEAYDHARLRLLRLVAGDLDGAVAPIPGLTAAEQDYWSKQMFAISTMLDHASQPELKRRAAAAGIHLATANDEIQQLASLSVRNLTFCDEVVAFGNYRERASRRFKPGEKITVYVELANFVSKKADDGYHTVIGSSCQVLDGRGARVDGQTFKPFRGQYLSRRRDFYMAYTFPMPERIYPGEYQLELNVTDELGGKIGRASIDFEIVE